MLHHLFNIDHLDMFLKYAVHQIFRSLLGRKCEGDFVVLLNESKIRKREAGNRAERYSNISPYQFAKHQSWDAPAKQSPRLFSPFVPPTSKQSVMNIKTN